jgi:hypothetical protein
MVANHCLTAVSANPDGYSKIITQRSTMQYVPTSRAVVDRDLEPRRKHV